MTSFDPSAQRPKRHAPGAPELRYRCPRLHDGRKDKRYTLTWNRHTGLFHCHWSGCGYSGCVSETGVTLNPKEPRPSLPPDAVPPELYPLFHARGVDAEYTIRRYKVQYRDMRLLWPGTPGYAGRATIPGQQPKQLCMDGFSAAAGSLIGGHLLRPGAHLVIVQGDWGCAAVPPPWVGVGIESAYFHDTQAARVVLSSPSSVTLCGDGGEPMRLPEVLERSGIEVRRVAELPPRYGIDDLPMQERVERLLGAGRV